MSRLNSIWLFVRRHKYWVIISLIVVIDGFVDENSYFNRYQHRLRLDALRSEIQVYQDQFDNADKRMQELDSNPRAVEKLARERYYMKRASEDVFVIVDEDDDIKLTPEETPQS